MNFNVFVFLRKYYIKILSFNKKALVLKQLEGVIKDHFKCRLEQL